MLSKTAKNQIVLKKRSFKTIKSKYDITSKLITHEQKQNQEVLLKPGKDRRKEFNELMLTMQDNKTQK